MAINPIQFHQDTSLSQLFEQFGTEALCEAALKLKRQIGVCYPIAWRTKHNIMQVMLERESRRTLHGTITSLGLLSHPLQPKSIT